MLADRLVACPSEVNSSTSGLVVHKLARLDIVGTPSRVDCSKLKAGEVVDGAPRRVGRSMLEAGEVVRYDIFLAIILPGLVFGLLMAVGLGMDRRRLEHIFIL